MINQLVKKDGIQFKKTRKISGKRPASFWLLFLKKYLLVKQPFRFDPFLLIFLIPVILIMAAIYFWAIDNNQEFSDGFFTAAFISFFACFITYAIVSIKIKKNFIHSPTFHHLARFIIHIKGDVHKELISLRMDNSIIEAKENFVPLEKLGLKNASGLVYKPYEMERYALKFNLNDGSKGFASLHQITVRVRSTKRRSSGKTKTKVKFKHKFFYQLLLTLPKSKYKVMDQAMLTTKQKMYAVAISEDATYFYVKLKFKQKPPFVAKKIIDTVEDDASYFTKMLIYAKGHYLFTPLVAETNTTIN